MVSVRYSWSQPCCADCWDQRHPGRTPLKFVPEFRETETCVYCGKPQFDGIYIRIDPTEAPHPTLLKD